MFKKILIWNMILAFFMNTIIALPHAHADNLSNLPAPGTLVDLSPAYQPVILKGLTVHKDNPFLFDFIVDVGQDRFTGEPLKKMGEKLIKYFLAGLAIPDKDLWVNLSPYEKDRMVPHALGQTDMGRDLLEQDYVLKQITASLIYPEKQLGKIFWDKVYAKAGEMYGTTEVPVNTFNKVWIMADRAEVFEHNQSAFVVGRHLKVMLEEDYLALQKHSMNPSSSHVLATGHTQGPSSHSMASQIIHAIVLPELEKEVNTGRNFAKLRQIFNSVILASWYKKNLKEAILNQVYAGQSKVRGIDIKDPAIKEKIYEQYLKAYKKGVFNYIKEDLNAAGTVVPRKYFSGGEILKVDLATITDPAQGAEKLLEQPSNGAVDFATVVSPDKDGTGAVSNMSPADAAMYSLNWDFWENIKDILKSPKGTNHVSTVELLFGALRYMRNVSVEQSSIRIVDKDTRWEGDQYPRIVCDKYNITQLETENDLKNILEKKGWTNFEVVLHLGKRTLTQSEFEEAGFTDLAWERVWQTVRRSRIGDVDANEGFYLLPHWEEKLKLEKPGEWGSGYPPPNKVFEPEFLNFLSALSDGKLTRDRSKEKGILTDLSTFKHTGDLLISAGMAGPMGIFVRSSWETELSPKQKVPENMRIFLRRAWPEKAVILIRIPIIETAEKVVQNVLNNATNDRIQRIKLTRMLAALGQPVSANTPAFTGQVSTITWKKRWGRWSNYISEITVEFKDGHKETVPVTYRWKDDISGYSRLGTLPLDGAGKLPLSEYARLYLVYTHDDWSLENASIKEEIITDEAMIGEALEETLKDARFSDGFINLLLARLTTPEAVENSSRFFEGIIPLIPKISGETVRTSFEKNIELGLRKISDQDVGPYFQGWAELWKNIKKQGHPLTLLADSMRIGLRKRTIITPTRTLSSEELVSATKGILDEKAPPGYQRTLHSPPDHAQSSHPINNDHLTRGGIDLNTSNGMQWIDRKDGHGVEMKVDPAMLARIKRQGLQGLWPVVLKITPIKDLWALIGLKSPVPSKLPALTGI